MLGTAERGNPRGTNQYTESAKSENHDFAPEPMSKREKDERWYARKIDDHWGIVEPILPTARHTPRARRNMTKGQLAMIVAQIFLKNENGRGEVIQFG